jgi:chromate transporter
MAVRGYHSLPMSESPMSESPPESLPDKPNVPTLFQLLVAFTLIAVSGFGGVLYWSRRMMVDKRKWMTAEEFNEAYALCNFLPGPNIVNFAVVFGRQFGGTVGAFLALFGLLAPPVAIVIVLGFLYAHFGDIEALQRMFVGVAAAAAGLTISTSIKMLEPLLRERLGVPHLIAISTFVGVGVLRWPIYWVLGVLVPVSIALTWWVRR